MIDRLHHDGAVLSPDRVFRYALSRSMLPLPCFPASFLTGGLSFVEPQRYCAFCLLNPSTANETEDDPTVRKCRGFAERWGFHAFDMVNAFALRATHPKELRTNRNPVADPENDRWIMAVARHATLVVVGWGNDGTVHNRGQHVRALLQAAGIPLHCWELNKGTGEPRHPLYVPYKQPLQLVPVRGVA